MFKKIYDNRDKKSLASSCRKTRFHLFCKLISSLEFPLRILDVGGTQEYWQNLDFFNIKGITITLLNLKNIALPLKGFESCEGDIRDMRQFKDKEFDVVFSNSVLEHLAKIEDQKKAADEIKRVGKRYFIQTPNYYFPVEPHFLFPLFQFLPERLKIFLLMHFNLGWVPRQARIEDAKNIIHEIRLLKMNELRELFPEGAIYEEKILGLTKSFIVYRWA